MFFIYLLGGYLKKYSSDERFSNKAIKGIWVSSTFAVFLLDCIVTAVTGSIHIPIARDCGAFVLLQALSIFILFKRYFFVSVGINCVSMHVLAAYQFEE